MHVEVKTIFYQKCLYCQIKGKKKEFENILNSNGVADADWMKRFYYNFCTIFFSNYMVHILYILLAINRNTESKYRILLWDFKFFGRCYSASILLF